MMEHDDRRKISGLFTQGQISTLVAGTMAIPNFVLFGGIVLVATNGPGAAVNEGAFISGISY
jgi:hypothetical protein